MSRALLKQTQKSESPACYTKDQLSTIMLVAKWALTFPPVTEKLANMQYFSFLWPVYVFKHWNVERTKEGYKFLRLNITLQRFTGQGLSKNDPRLHFQFMYLLIKVHKCILCTMCHLIVFYISLDNKKITVAFHLKTSALSCAHDW